MDCSPPGSSIHGILQARVLEWVAISFSRGSSRPRDQTRVSPIGGRCFTIWATREMLKPSPNGRNKLLDGHQQVAPSPTSARIDDVHPSDTTLLLHHQPIRELFMSWSYTLWPSTVFKTFPWKPLGTLSLLSMSCLFWLGPVSRPKFGLLMLGHLFWKMGYINEIKPNGN